MRWPSKLHNGLAYYVYKEPGKYELNKALVDYELLLAKWLKRIGLDPNDCHIDITSMVEALVRMDQRELHYKMYHNLMSWNELKQTAALCCWILKYKPIRPEISAKSIYWERINETFCLYLIMCAIKKYRALQNLPALALGRKNVVELIYLFKHRDISCDALAVVIETLANASYAIEPRFTTPFSSRFPPR